MDQQNSPSAVVVGAGPAGSLMSIFLANRGFRVDLVERIPDFSILSEKKTPVYVLNIRALKALRQAGLELPPDLALPLKGFSVHGGGTKNFQAFDASQPKSAVGRNELANFLLQEAQNHKSSRIRVHMGWTLYALEDEGEVARFRRTRSRTEETEQRLVAGMRDLKEGPEDRMDLQGYDLLVAADGTVSTVRDELVRMDAEKGGSKHERHAFVQKSLASKYKQLPPLSADQVRKSDMLGNAHGIQLFTSKTGALIMGIPKSDGCFYGILNIPTTRRLRAQMLTYSDDVTAFMESEFPELLKLYTQDNRQFADIVAKEKWVSGISITCSRFHSGKVVLIGDAAHSLPGTFGEGCNAALEDCDLLDQVLEVAIGKDELSSAIPKALSQFTVERKPELDALRELLEEASISGSLRPLTSSLQLVFRFTVLSLAQKVVPSWGPKQIDIDSDTSYIELKSELRRENLKAVVVFSGGVLCTGMIVLAAFHLWKHSRKAT